MKPDKTWLKKTRRFVLNNEWYTDDITSSKLINIKYIFLSSLLVYSCYEISKFGYDHLDMIQLKMCVDSEFFDGIQIEFECSSADIRTCRKSSSIMNFDFLFGVVSHLFTYVWAVMFTMPVDSRLVPRPTAWCALGQWCQMAMECVTIPRMSTSTSQSQLSTAAKRQMQPSMHRL